MERVRSKDGTPIACYRSGSGPTLILVHGTTADHSRWDRVLPALAQHFTVHTIDRRGRGGSGDANRYAIECEFDDVVAVVDSIGEPSYLLGHSYGGICALEAALLTTSIRKLILYEPAILLPGFQLYGPGMIARLEAMRDKGDREGVFTTYALDVVRMGMEDFARLRASPAWAARMAAALTIPRECRAQEAYSFLPERFASMTIPTLLLVGSESQPWLKAAAAAVNEGLPDSRIVVMPGQAHVAMETSPDLFVREVLAFLE